jgi:hypothetical protein
MSSSLVVATRKAPGKAGTATPAEGPVVGEDGVGQRQGAAVVLDPAPDGRAADTGVVGAAAGGVAPDLAVDDRQRGVAEVLDPGGPAGAGHRLAHGRCSCRAA